MAEKIHKITRNEQGINECVQASAAQLLEWYGVKKTLEDVKADVPVYIGKNGKPLGTSLGHIATYFRELGFDVDMHLFDVQIFDLSWKDLTAKDMIQKLSQRRPFVKHGYYDDEILDVVFDGYTQFLEKGGTIKLGFLDPDLLRSQLNDSPIYAVLSYNMFHQIPRYVFEGEKPEQDSIKGSPATHAVVLAGYRDKEFLVVDPDYEYGGELWVSEPRLVSSILTAQHDFDAMYLVLKKQ